jgi:hypothetical protein
VDGLEPHGHLESSLEESVKLECSWSHKERMGLDRHAGKGIQSLDDGRSIASSKQYFEKQ